MKKIFILLVFMLFVTSPVFAKVHYVQKVNYQPPTLSESSNRFNDDIRPQKPNSLEASPYTNTIKIKNASDAMRDYIILNGNTDVSEIMGKTLAAINDPYVIKVDGVKYYMVRKSDTGKYTLNNIVGYGDDKTSLFTSLTNLNSDSDKSKLTKAELDKANIRFVALNSGKLQLADEKQDFKDVVYINLFSLRESINTGAIGSFGYFDVYIKDKRGSVKKIIGYVSFDSDAELSEMLK